MGTDAERARRSRRHRRTAATLALAALGVAVSGVVLIPRLGADPPELAPAPANVMPTPPAGMRWVGHGDQVVAVPSSWTTDDAPCNSPQSDTVYVAGELLYDCLVDVGSRVSSLRIVPPTGASGPGFEVESLDPRLRERVLGTRRQVPAGWTTVPWPSAITGSVSLKLVQAGFDVEVTRHYFHDEIGDARTTTSPT